jgi:methylphosphotriester-DNA--protein-cysteine methyltransferase
MERPTRFENHRWLGDKRTQIVHDLDNCPAPDVIEELLEAQTYLAFGPDTLAEARNRGYRLCRRCEGVRAAAEVGE